MFIKFMGHTHRAIFLWVILIGISMAVMVPRLAPLLDIHTSNVKCNASHLYI